MWHLDHIVPLNSGIGNPDLLMRLNHYKNLQPLLAKENCKKNGSIPHVWPEGVPFTREEVLASYEKYKASKARDVEILEIKT